MKNIKRMWKTRAENKEDKKNSQSYEKYKDAKLGKCCEI